MNALTARLMVVSEADNYQYAELKLAEEKAHARQKENKSGPQLWHWHDWTRVSEIAKKPFWDAKLPIETRNQLIAQFEVSCIKLLYGKMIADYQRDEQWDNETAVEQARADIDTGWMLDSYICHRIDGIIRSAGISLQRPQAKGFGARI